MLPFSQFGEVVAPHPPCMRLNGTRAEGGNVVIGMLKNPIKVKLLKATKDTKGRNLGRGQGVEIELRNVLVVKKLPVPLHISTKADWSVLDTGGFDPNFADNRKMQKGNFPQRFRDHPYWIPNGVHYIGLSDEIDELTAGLAQCMEEGDGKDARNELAVKYGWLPMEPKQKGVESWMHEDTGDRIDYYPKRDRVKITLKSHPRDEHGMARGNPNNKDLVRDDIGGNAGLAKIFQDIRHHSGKGRYTKK